MSVSPDFCQLAPLDSINYVGLTIDFSRRDFQPAELHRAVFEHLYRTASRPRSARAALVVRGFLAFILSVTVRQ